MWTTAITVVAIVTGMPGAVGTIGDGMTGAGMTHGGMTAAGTTVVMTAGMPGGITPRPAAITTHVGMGIPAGIPAAGIARTDSMTDATGIVIESRPL